MSLLTCISCARHVDAPCIMHYVSCKVYMYIQHVHTHTVCMYFKNILACMHHYMPAWYYHMQVNFITLRIFYTHIYFIFVVLAGISRPSASCDLRGTVRCGLGCCVSRQMKGCDAWLCMAMPYAPLLKLQCGGKVMETLKEEFVNHVEIIGVLI